MALIKLIALAAVAPRAAPLVPRARRRAPLLRRASTQQGTLPPEESAAPDWEAMYLAGGDTSRESAPPQRPGPVITGVSASPVAATMEGFEECVDALQRLNIDARIEDTLGDDLPTRFKYRKVSRVAAPRLAGALLLTPPPPPPLRRSSRRPSG